MLRGLWLWAVLILVSIACGIPAALVSAVRPRSDTAMRLARLWSRALLATAGARVEYVGLEHCHDRGPRVFVSNHQSYVDIWALIRVLPLSTRFIAKQELRRVPVIGLAMAVSGFIFVDRADRGRAIDTLQEAAARIRGGRSVMVFAEGTRTRDGLLQPFKKGPFHLALEAGVPIVPVIIHGSWQILRPATLRVRPGSVRVRFLEPVDVRPYRPQDVIGLLQHVHALFREHLPSASAGTS